MSLAIIAYVQTLKTNAVETPSTSMFEVYVYFETSTKFWLKFLKFPEVSEVSKKYKEIYHT